MREAETDERSVCTPVRASAAGSAAMGCVSSKSLESHRVELESTARGSERSFAGVSGAAEAELAPIAWLSQIGLAQYSGPFRLAGYEDESMLHHLQMDDIEAVERFAGVTIPPGHRRKILIASEECKRLRSSGTYVTAELQSKASIGSQTQESLLADLEENALFGSPRGLADSACFPSTPKKRKHEGHTPLANAHEQRPIVSKDQSVGIAAIESADAGTQDDGVSAVAEASASSPTSAVAAVEGSPDEAGGVTDGVAPTPDHPSTSAALGEAASPLARARSDSQERHDFQRIEEEFLEIEAALGIVRRSPAAHRTPVRPPAIAALGLRNGRDAGGGVSTPGVRDMSALKPGSWDKENRSSPGQALTLPELIAVDATTKSKVTLLRAMLQRAEGMSAQNREAKPASLAAQRAKEARVRGAEDFVKRRVANIIERRWSQKVEPS